MQRLDRRGHSRCKLRVLVHSPTWGVFRAKYSMIGTAVATIPEGIVKGPEMVLPRKSVVSTGGLIEVDMFGCKFYLLVRWATIHFQRTQAASNLLEDRRTG